VRAPDLVVPVVGFRRWRVLGHELFSPYVPESWPRRRMRAECRRAPHAAPDHGCTCGIYAAHEPVHGRLTFSDGTVPGIVSLRGRLEVHASGVRAEEATLEALAHPPGGPRGLLADLRAVASDLGVDLVDVRELAAVAHRYGAPVPPDLRPPARA
jgi:hypothetical protein